MKRWLFIFRYDQKYYIADRSDYLDLRGTSDYPEYMSDDMVWCHGWAGIVLAQKTAMKYVQSPFRSELEQSIDTVLRGRRDQPMKEKQCLCHGNAGNKIIWEYLMKEFGQAGAEQKMEELCVRIKSDELENYGLLSGLSGIGLCDICSPEEMIWLLTLE